MIRIVIVDDSATARTCIRTLLSRSPDVSVVGEADDGDQAVEMVRRLKPDLVTMDIHMPGMDGIAAIRKILLERRIPIVVLSKASTVVAEAYAALDAGAVDVLPLPQIDAAGQISGPPGFAALLREIATSVGLGASGKPQALSGGARTSPSLVVVAASAGGPKALKALLQALPLSFSTPILIAQHTSSGFLNALVSWLSSGTRPVAAAENGMRLRPGCICLAPEDNDLLVGGDFTLRIVPADKSTFHPSADRLFESAAAAYGAHVTGIVLSGMGTDGARGAKAIAAAGGQVLVQTPSHAAVSSMPLAAIGAVPAATLGTPEEIAQRFSSG